MNSNQVDEGEYRPQGSFKANGDPNVTANSHMTDGRRRYPRDRDGAKNEWRALIQHQAQVNEQINQFEKDIKTLKSQQLGQAYDQKLHEQIQMKESQLRQKQDDAQTMNSHIKQYQGVILKSLF